MKKSIVVLFLILCVLLVSGTAFAKGQSEENFKAVMGSSSLGGTWYSCACKIGAVAEQYEGLNITVQATGGGAENIRLMAQNEAQLGLAEPSIASYAYNATSIFQGDPHKDIRFITDLYPNALCAMVMKAGNIKTFEDLKAPAGAKKIGFCFGSPGSGDELVWIEALSGFGITKDMLLMMMDEKDWDDVVSVNLKSVFNYTKVASTVMLRQRSGSIVNLSSIAGVVGNIGQCNYAATKAGIIGFTKSIAKEIGRRNIRCNAIAPGLIDTDMTRNMPEEARNAIASNIALRRIGKPEEIANTALFLASDLSSYINGQVIICDGGM